MTESCLKKTCLLGLRPDEIPARILISTLVVQRVGFLMTMPEDGNKSTYAMLHVTESFPVSFQIFTRQFLNFVYFLKKGQLSLYCLLGPLIHKTLVTHFAL